MKIVHLCLGDRFADNYNYQVNSLIKYQKKIGYDIEVIASCEGFDREGHMVHNLPARKYVGECGILITRIPYKRDDKFYYRFRKFRGLKTELEKAKPDILFMHNIQFADVPVVVRFLKENPQVIAYADNHADFSNSAKNWLSMNIIHKVIWKRYAQMIAPYLKKIYGVLPARVDFLEKVYELPSSKCELLVMGADDEWVNEAKLKQNKSKIRQQYGFAESDFVVVSGGKINQYRPETLYLMEAIIESERNNLKLLIFGNVEESLKAKFDTLCKSDRVRFAGWQNSKETYYLMAAADLVVFPGLHSVMWEQAVALGVPCIFRDIDGFHHVDLGGNALFLKDVSSKSLQKEIEKLSLDTSLHESMREIAESKGMKAFSYLSIAKRSIGLENI